MKVAPLFITLFLLPAIAAAQPWDPPLLEVRTGAGVSDYLHADIGGIAPSFRAAVRIGPSHFAVEPEFVFARLRTTPFQSPSARVTSTRRFQSLGVNAIARWPNRRFSPYAGGGVGIYSERRRTLTESSSNTFETEVKGGPRAGVQALGGLDVWVYSRFSVLAEMRYEMRSFADPGGGSVVQGFGGVVINIR
jgi:opacity protein-like surface antigen